MKVSSICNFTSFVLCAQDNILCVVLQAAEGTGLAFIVFTQAIVELPGAPFWAVIFFLMLLALGIGSQIGILEGMLCTIFDIDIFKRIRKQYVTGEVAEVKLQVRQSLCVKLTQAKSDITLKCSLDSVCILN
jgi:Na+-dependent transporters of the SNF family